MLSQLQGEGRHAFGTQVQGAPVIHMPSSRTSEGQAYEEEERGDNQEITHEEGRANISNEVQFQT